MILLENKFRFDHLGIDMLISDYIRISMSCLIMIIHVPASLTCYIFDSICICQHVYNNLAELSPWFHIYICWYGYGLFSWVHLIFGIIHACWRLYQFHESFNIWFLICLSIESILLYPLNVFHTYMPQFLEFALSTMVSSQALVCLHPCFLIAWIYCIGDLCVFNFVNCQSISIHVCLGLSFKTLIASLPMSLNSAYPCLCEQL